MMHSKLDIYGIIYFRDDVVVNSNGPIPGRRPIFLAVGGQMAMGMYESAGINQIDFDEDNRRFMVSLSTHMMVSIPYSDEIEVIYYDKEAYGRDIQNKRKQENI